MKEGEKKNLILILSHVNHTFFISIPQIEPPTFRHIHCTLGKKNGSNSKFNLLQNGP
jgi:hypothetical protein